jgi:hypothetical protein
MAVISCFSSQGPIRAMEKHVQSAAPLGEETPGDGPESARRHVLLNYTLSILCLLLSLYVLERAIRDTLLWTSSLPIFDQSTSIFLTNQWLTHTLPLRTIYRWHNEHLIIAPQLVYLLDIILFKNRNGFLVLCSWALVLSHAAVFLYFIRGRLRSHWALLASAAVIAALFSPTQMENFKTGFQIAYFLAQVFATFAIAFLAGGQESRVRWKALIGAVLCGSVASVSFASGICLWPVVVLLLVRLPASKAQRVVGFSLAGLITAVLLWLRAIQYPHPAVIRPQIGQSWDFFSAMIGISWSYDPSSISSIVAVISIAAMTALGIRFLTSKTLSSLSAFTTGVALFSFLWLVGVVFGRASAGIENAHIQRYQTTVLCYLASLFVGILEWAFVAGWPVVQGMAVAFLGALIMSIPTWHTIESRSRGDAQYLQRVEAAVKVGVHDPEILTGSLLFDANTMPEFELSRKYGYSLFADGENRWLGEPLGKYFKVGEPCSGRILERRAIQSQYPGTFIRGTKPKRSKRIIVTSGGRIVGLGAAKIQDEHDWLAYTRPASEPLEIYAVASRSSVCQIGAVPN